MRTMRFARKLWVISAVPIVAALSAPTMALADTNAGVGVMEGTAVPGSCGPTAGGMCWASGQGQPTNVGGNNFVCFTTSWTFNATAAFIVASAVPAASYPGPIAVGAQGGSSCAFTSVESGAWSETMVGTGVQGEFQCGTPGTTTTYLTGTYLRVGNEEVVDIFGNCTVALRPENRVQFVAAGTQVPVSTSGGQIAAADFAAGFALFPD